ncbi:MAG: polysaccharide biosynthesis tyrosine autokinase [Elainella sp. Prado103]|jgi:capsular exopolysaccharide synthesis family protein|nr:polysaccharide biosynthesis tyrosine autokinase [Elainella sp. Prado103]
MDFPSPQTPPPTLSNPAALPDMRTSFALPQAPSAPTGGDFDPRRFLQMLQRRIVVVAGVAGIALAFTIRSTLNQPLIYQSSFRLLIEPINADNSLSNLTEGTGNQSGQLQLDYDTQLQVLRSPDLMAKISEQVAATYPGSNYQFLPSNLNVVRLGETKILEVKYQADDPSEVKAVLDQAVQVYLRYSLSERQTNLRQGIQFIEKQLPPIQERVNALQDELQAFRQRYNFIDPESQSNQVSQQTSTLDQQQQTVEQKLAQARFNFSVLQEEAGSAVVLNESPNYQKLIADLQAIESQIATELTRFKPQSLTIRVLQEKKQNLLPLLRQEASRSLGAKLAGAAIEIRSLEIQQAAILTAQNQVAIQAQQLPILSRNYNDLQRELEIANESLNRFQTARETLQIQAAQTEIPWQVIQTPTLPRSPIGADTNRSLLIGILISAALGAGAAFLLEKVDSSFHTATELKQTRLPVLGVLPLCPSLQDQSLSWIDQISHQLTKKLTKRKTSRRRLSSTQALKLDSVSVSVGFTEALRVFHTNLRLLNVTQPLRSVVVTSALPGEGKSTLSFHLAQTARTMGQRVLLVDTDLRQPQLQQWFNLAEQKGLSDVLVENVPIKEALAQPYPEASFFMLTAGNVPVDPTQLLGSAKMQRLMSQLNQTFDLVIYDAPPLLGLADASLIATQTDGILLVVRLDKTDKTAVQQAVETLAVLPNSTIGIVANGLRYSENAPEEVD